MQIYIGLDIGSTTTKIIAMRGDNTILFKRYKRHFSDIKNSVVQLLEELKNEYPSYDATISISGSAGMRLASELQVPFVQEVIACTETVEKFVPETDVVIELGGEDAKIIYIANGMEQRMNSACAGGTGAFIDQMATLLHTDPTGLNEYAKNYTTIYPIASRCGVFAKTDVQPLINEGVKKEDISASIFQSVVNQTISGLSCGRKIKGKVTFLGGPLTFLSELRNRFIETLKLAPSEQIFPENSLYYVAIGTAIKSKTEQAQKLEKIIENVNQVQYTSDNNSTLQPLFSSEEEINRFLARHNKAVVPLLPLDSCKESCYVGIDAGSTTTKIVAINEQEEVIYQYYTNNKGNPLQSVIDGLTDVLAKLPDDVKIKKTAVTGYGEGLIKAALKIDIGEIETVAHYKAALKFQPDVDCILDIGGQDMKCIKIKNGTIDSIALNEACSAGCGSFLESFANNLGLTIEEFANAAVASDAPADLGSRCTVFMNSKVKQVQKEGVSISNLSAGLSYSVIKNALQKVLKMRSPKDIGEKVIVQGGTFYNNSVLRAFEQLTGLEVIRPNIAGMMGAYGCALIAKERSSEKEVTTMLSIEELETFHWSVSQGRCKQCGNQCALTINRFSDKSFHITGNRCEKGSGKRTKKNDLPNLFAYKNERMFSYEAKEEHNIRGRVGIPRGLNMYENYPLWYTFLTKLGYEVVLSSPSSKKQFERGMDTIPSESICYPAKMIHGHIEELIEKQVDFIFYPSVVYEKKEVEKATNQFNCPIVSSYPEVIRVNVDTLKEKNIPFKNPFVSLEDEKSLRISLEQEFTHIPKKELHEAIHTAWLEQEKAKDDIRKKGEETLAFLEKTNTKAIVLAGRPYHIDPAINHGIPELITGMGLAVLSEDSIAHLGVQNETLRVTNQWTYHSRLYQSAQFVSKRDDIELVQLTSFGCGLDAITADMVQEIIESNNKVYTLIKIDENSNLGAARIRIRSLIAAMIEREEQGITNEKIREEQPSAVFTKQMKTDYTILAPEMLPIHFHFFENSFRRAGYKMVALPSAKRTYIEEGLKYVNNDACYPAILVIGQFIEALKSGKYDVNKTAVILSQTGGGCRATNYIALLKKALKDAGLEQVPVLSLNSLGMEKQPGFTFTAPLLNNLVMGACFGDLLMRVSNRIRPYEIIKGSTAELVEKWKKICVESLQKFSIRDYIEVINRLVKDFDSVPIRNESKPRVGIVGEIYVKFNPAANNFLVHTIEEEGGEAVLPDFIDFMNYTLLDKSFNSKQYGKSKVDKYVSKTILEVLNLYRKPVVTALKRSKRFAPPKAIANIAENATQVLSLGNQMGEGWLLTGEMIDHIEEGVNNVICIQPFGCLPNHIVGRGMIKGVKDVYPQANIVSIDYDAGSSEVNQVNRIKLMMSIAHKNRAVSYNTDTVIPSIKEEALDLI